MDKILQATSRGQITLPKNWRDKFNTTYYSVEMQNDQLVLKPLIKKKNLEEELEDSWQQYKDGKFITNEDLMKKYGL